MLKCPHFRVRTGYKPTQTLMKKKKTNKKNKQNTRKKEKKKKDRTKNNKSRVTRCSLAIVIYTERR